MTAKGQLLPDEPAPDCRDCHRLMVWTPPYSPHVHGYYSCHDCPCPERYAREHDVCPTCLTRDCEYCSNVWHLIKDGMIESVVHENGWAKYTVKKTDSTES